jgi:hypothetical protein
MAKGVLSIPRAERLQVVNRAARSLATSIIAPLIRINGDAVAEKPQSTGNSHRGYFAIALPEFIFYRDTSPR